MKRFVIILIIIFCATILLSGCIDSSREEELEQRIVKLQKELAEREQTIQKMQEITKDAIDDSDIIEEGEDIAEKTEESIVLKTINGYIDAVEKNDFFKQREYVDKYASNLVDLKEDEHRKPRFPAKSSFDIQPAKVLEIDGDKAEAFMSFTENIENYDGSKYALITEGKVYLEKIAGEWKITDYTRKNRLISEALYVFKDDSVKTVENNIELELKRVLFSIYDRYVIVNFKLTNSNNEPLNIASFNSAVVDPNRMQYSYMFSDEAFSNEILANAKVIGDIQFNWHYDVASDFEFYSGYFYDSDGYTFCDGLSFLVELKKAQRY